MLTAAAAAHIHPAPFARFGLVRAAQSPAAVFSNFLLSLVF